VRIAPGEDAVPQQRDDRAIVVPDLSPDPGRALNQRGARDALGLVGGEGLDGVAVIPGELAGQAAAACARFCADETARTCGKCGMVATPLDLAPFGWPPGEAG